MTNLLDHLNTWLPRQRWFAGKGRSIAGLTVAQSVTLRTGEPGADLMVLAVELDGGGTEYYQVLVGRRGRLPVELEHVAIGAVDGQVAYDGIWDPELSSGLLDALAAGDGRDWLRFVPEPGAEIPTGLSGRVLGVEQSNTSVAYGDEVLLKLFRRLAPGINPDLELHRALRERDSKEVAGLRAAIEGTLRGEPTVFGLLQDYAANSADGWSMALISIRDLFAEADLRADEVGGDFSGEAFRLGQTVAILHAELAGVLGVTTVTPESLRADMHAQLDVALAEVAELAELTGPLRAAFDEVGRLPEPVPAQRIHGDLHLGQTLRTPTGWLLIDFEGEPERPLTERRKPNPALRDVAGMLRSFDYAAYHQLSEWGEWAYPSEDAEPEGQLAWRAEEWAGRNRNAFCDGYADTTGSDPRESALLLRALELDKAVYETVYETRNRPSWLPVPLRSLRRLLTPGT
ncbi:maltokinase N-terminal cap-like domain-containing protein [Pseudonocardia acaciae]|uniref:maltokinase N-terminal cap-like domain-containing protein n=1 Tax=Pseudonocardia acaciae TaxID=551276 RepID=UPI00048B832B|nr:aminoglycoside phosphotransferase [Pseudonocardia acaciae]